MPNPILSAAELRSLLMDPDVVLLDARASAADYGSGHLRGAQRADLERDLSAAADPASDPASGGRHPLPPFGRWLERMASWGIGPDTRVVIYDDQNGANAAARAWWMLRSAGHQFVQVLDGGYAAAVEAGIETTTDVPIPRPAPHMPAAAKQWERPTVDLETVDRLRLDPAWRVLDVRSAPRFRGETEPIDPVAGHIPGAVNLFFGENLEHGRFKSPEALRAQYEQFLGDIPPAHLVVHCGSGVTACHTLLALEAAGLDGASLYNGSWGEWCRNDLPRATGD